MKKVITGTILDEKMDKAINLLCDSVKVTLGPSGNNVMIDKDFAPFITNDGVTIAESLETDDECVNAILNIAREAAIKTNEVVGDGTTTTLVLLQSLYNNGKRLILNGKNPLVLKKELDLSVKEIIKLLNKISKTPKHSDYRSIASISANDEKIGLLVSDLFLKIKQKGGIKVNESFTNNTYSEIINGYILDETLVSDYFFYDNKEITLKNPYVMLINKELYTIEQISDILNIFIEEKRDFVIIAEDYSKEFINDFVVLYMQKTLNGVLLKIPDYGSRKYEVLKDISIFTGSKIIDFNFNRKVDLNDIKVIDEAKFDKNKTLLINNNKNNEVLQNRIDELNSELLKCENYDKEYMSERIAKLKNGFGIIYVGAPTKTERREKKMGTVDSVNAVFSAMDGILPGEGTALLQVSELIKEINDGNKILKLALKAPFLQIMSNLGKDSEKVLEKIQEKDYKEIYNCNMDKLEKISETKILDSTLVVTNALLNAVSIAGMLLTTKYLIINSENINNYDIIN